MTENIISTPGTAAATTTIELLGKPYQIKCQENEVAALQKAAEYLNNTMKSLPASGKLLAPEKLGVMAALNLASQLLELEQQMSQHLHFLNQRLGNLQSKIENALNLSSDLPFSAQLEIDSAAQA
jgi:cell division protein ZapA